MLLLKCYLVRRSHLSRIYTAVDEWRSVEHWWNETDRGQLKGGVEKLSQAHPVHHKPQLEWPGIESGSQSERPTYYRLIQGTAHSEIMTGHTERHRTIAWRFNMPTLFCRDTRWRSGWGTALQAGRSRVRFPIMLLEFFIDIFLPAALWP
jgi:hypothetical protein